MLHWALLLSASSYDISYHSTKLHANADALSRLPLVHDQTNDSSCVCFDSLFNVGQLETLPVTSKQLASATSNALCTERLAYTGVPRPEALLH